MGLPHLQITRMYKQSLINSDLNVFNLPYFSIIETSSLNGGVTDSAAAITAILSGEKKLITIELIRALLEQLYHLLPTNLKKEATRSELYQLIRLLTQHQQALMLLLMKELVEMK